MRYICNVIHDTTIDETLDRVFQESSDKFPEKILNNLADKYYKSSGVRILIKMSDKVWWTLDEYDNVCILVKKVLEDKDPIYTLTYQGTKEGLYHLGISLSGLFTTERGVAYNCLQTEFTDSIAKAFKPWEPLWNIMHIKNHPNYDVIAQDIKNLIINKLQQGVDVLNHPEYMDAARYLFKGKIKAIKKYMFQRKQNDAFLESIS